MTIKTTDKIQNAVELKGAWSTYYVSRLDVVDANTGNKTGYKQMAMTNAGQYTYYFNPTAGGLASADDEIEVLVCTVKQ